MAGSSTEVSSLIKELRREHKLTQVQLAVALGLSPATVYRYEAGTRPDTSALLSLLKFAEKSGPAAVRNALREIVSERIMLPGDSEQARREHPGEASFGRTLTRATAELNDEERLRMLAFISFLRENTDLTAEKMLALLLQPWIEHVKDKDERDQPRENDSAPEKST